MRRSNLCCGAISAFLDDARTCVCREAAVRSLFEQADPSSVSFMSHACRVDLHGVVTAQVRSWQANRELMYPKKLTGLISLIPYRLKCPKFKPSLKALKRP